MDYMFMIFLWFALLCVCLIAIIFIGKISVWLKIYAMSIDNKKELNEFVSSNKYAESRLAYTKEFLEIIRTFVIDNSTLEFDNFKDSVKTEKVNRQILAKFIVQVADSNKNSLNLKQEDYDMLLVTEDYIDEFIANTTIIAIKHLFEQHVEEFSEMEELL